MRSMVGKKNERLVQASADAIKTELCQRIVMWDGADHKIFDGGLGAGLSQQLLGLIIENIVR